MIQDYAIIRESAARVAQAAEGAVDALRDGRVQQEPAFTDRMLGRIEEAMRNFEVKGVRWSAMTLTDRGRGAQERTYGSDFAGVLDIRLAGYAVRKGFLAQAKLIEPNQYIPPTEYGRMREQCEAMLARTPDAFVFVYSLHGIIIVPAISIVSADNVNPHELYNRSISRFFELHFECFIGDRDLSSPNIGGLKRLRERIDARRLLLLKAHE